jgi:small subunit ribosomal protein S7
MAEKNAPENEAEKKPAAKKAVKAEARKAPAKKAEAPKETKEKPAVQAEAQADIMAEKAEEAQEAREEKPKQPEKKRPKYKALLFNKWDVSEVKVNDPGLRMYVNIEPIIVPRTGGKFTANPIHKHKQPLVERFMNKLMVPGHRGKKHKITSGKCSGNAHNIYLATRKAFERIEEKTKKNPLQVLVDALENAALLEEIAAYRMGGMIARKAVTVSALRRYDLALRHMAQGIYKTNFKSKRPLANVIADEIMAAAANDPKNFAIQERMRIEKEAEGAR